MSDSDSVLLKKISNGDANAQNELLDKYKNLVKIKSRPFFLVGSDQEDLIQEGMIGLYNAICDYKFQMGTSFATFAELCITRRMITAIKSANRQKHMPMNNYLSIELTTSEHLFENGLSPEDILIEKEDKQNFEQNLMNSLSKLEKNVLLNYLNGKNYSEIAKIISKEEKSVDNALQRIRKKIDKINAKRH